MQRSAEDILAIHSINMDREGPAAVPSQSLASWSQLVNRLIDLHTLLPHTFQRQNIVSAHLPLFPLFHFFCHTELRKKNSHIICNMNDLGSKYFFCSVNEYSDGATL